MNELQPDIKRQADHIIRGYNYQAYQTILAWLNCGKDEEILTEFAEDLDLIKRDAEGKVTAAELTQVKNEKKNLTLNSKASTDLINNFFEHKKRNPDLTLYMRLCTVSDRGNENKFDWKYTNNGLDLWDLVKKQELSSSEQNEAIGILKSFYSQKTDVSKDVINFVTNSDNTSLFEEFINRISWDTGQLQYKDIEKEIKKCLATLPRPIDEPNEVEQIVNRLWYVVTHKIAGEVGKTLNRSNLEEILSKETSATVDRKILKNMATDSSKTVVSLNNIEKIVSAFNDRLIQHTQDTTPVQVIKRQTYKSNIPPLPNPCADRSQELMEIVDKIENDYLIWIHGSTGYGKTTLANLLIRQISKNCLWFRLRNYSDFNLISALQEICIILGTVLKNEDIIVLDDLSIIEQNTQSIELITIITDLLKRKSAKLLITSQYKIPSKLKNQIEDNFFELVAPEISDSDIKILLKRSGLEDENKIDAWSKYIYASTIGHPQLVSAYVVYAKENGWEIKAEMLLDQPRTVDEVKTESRKLLSETIRSIEASIASQKFCSVYWQFDFLLTQSSMLPLPRVGG